MTCIARRQLGANGLTTSAIGLGCMGMSDTYGLADDERCLATLHHALDRGIDLLDTADVYGAGHNERLLARLLRERRDEVVLASKFGLTPTDPERRVDGRPDAVRRACDASLRRLGVEAIDLYYLHRVDPEVAIEETVGAMAELVAAGKVRHLGLSEVAPATLRRAYAEHPVAAVQLEYSLWTRDIEAALLPTMRDLGVGMVAFSPLGRGFLSAAIRSAADLAPGDWRRDNPRFQGENLQRNLDLVATVEALARDNDASPAQIALAWLTCQGADVVPIPGTTRPERVDENLGALEIALSADERARLDAVFTPDAVAGARYGEAAMALVQR